MNSLPLSLRQKKILYLLQNQTSYVTSAEIARKLNVSSRTVRNEILKMNGLLAPYRARIRSERSKGFLLEADDPQALRKRSRVDTATLSREERIRYLTFRLCQSAGPLNLYDLEEEIFVSRSTLMSDLHGLIQRISQEPPFARILIKGDEVRLQADEKKTRQILLSLFHNDWDYRTAGTLYYGTRFLDEKLLDALQGETMRIMYRHGLILDDPSLTALSLELAIMYHRVSQGHVLPGTSEGQEPPAAILRAAEDLLSFIEKKTDSPRYPESEKKDICRFIAHAALYLDDWNLSESSRFSRETGIKEEVYRYLDRILSVYHVDFSNDTEFVETLCIFLFQVSSGSSLFSHHQVSEIKERLSAEYELAMLYQHLAPDFVGRFLTENELCSLALCFGGAIRNYLEVHPDKKLKTVLFCHSNIVNAWAMKRKILESFDLYLEITHILPLSYQELFNYDGTDLILVTGGRKPSASDGICTVMIDDTPRTDPEEIAMLIKLRSFRNIWPVRPFSIRTLLEEAFWIEESEAGDPLQLIEEMGREYTGTGIAGESHLLNMTRREARSSFAFKPGIVFLFTILPAKETRLAVATLRHRIRWNEYRVGTAIMALFKEEDLNLLFQLKILFGSRAFDPDELHALRTKESLLPYLCGKTEC